MIQASGLNHDIERLAGAIRNVFLVQRDLSETAVQKLHNELVTYVTEINARLKKCDDLMRRGLRQEALQECEEEPNLLELVTQLDFPEWDAWGDYVSQFGLPPQPPLLLDVAAELNQAYTTAQSLEGLLKMHRLHALARSPLTARLTVLRAIAVRDPNNPSWEQDLETYETVRLKQLRLDFRTNDKDGNLHAVAELRRELESSDWLVCPPAELVDEVNAGHQRLVTEDARRHLATLEPKINAAFAAFDVSAVGSLRDTWNRYWPLANLSGNDSLAVRVRSAFAWLEDELTQQATQAEYERDLAALDAALDDEQSRRHDIVRLYGALERYNEPIPARLQRRYDERLRSLDLANRRKHRLILATSILAVVLIVATIGLLTFQRLRKSEIVAAEKALQQFIEDNRPQQGAQFYDQLMSQKPNVAKAPEVQAAYARVQGKINEEVERQNRLARLLADANDLLTKPTWESVTFANKLLKDAHAIEATDAERVNVLTLDGRLQNVTANLQHSVDAQFDKDVTALRNSVGSDSTLTMTQARTLLREAQALQGRSHVSDTAHQASGIDIVVHKLNDRINQLTLAQNTQELLQNVIMSCGRPSDYQLAIQRYLAADANSPRATDFKEVLDQDISLVTAQSEWNKTATAWNSLRLTSTKDAKAAIPTIEALTNSFADYPLVDDVLELRPYVDSIIAREKPDETTIFGELRKVLNENVFNIKHVRDPRQDDYLYFFGEPMKKGSSYELVVLLDSRDWTKTKLQRLSGEQYESSLAGTKSTDSPQKRFADRANQMLMNNSVTYEHALCAILHYLFTDENMDPILKCWLLQTFYESGSPGSSIVAEEMRGFRKQLDSKYTLGDTNFLSRSDPQVITIRANTADLLSRIPEGPREIYVARIQPRVQKAIEDTIKLPRIEWTGLLLRSSDQSWKVYSPKPLSKGDLCVVRKNDQGNLQLQIIGNSDGNSPQVASDSAGLSEGKPVFVLARE